MARRQNKTCSREGAAVGMRKLPDTSAAVCNHDNPATRMRPHRVQAVSRVEGPRAEAKIKLDIGCDIMMKTQATAPEVSQRAHQIEGRAIV